MSAERRRQYRQERRAARLCVVPGCKRPTKGAYRCTRHASDHAGSQKVHRLEKQKEKYG